MNKNIAVIISGAPDGDNLKEVSLPPGSTAGDVLQAIGLADGYLLSREGSSQPFAAEETIYDSIADGGKLRATPVALVGSTHRICN